MLSRSSPDSHFHGHSSVENLWATRRACCGNCVHDTPRECGRRRPKRVVCACAAVDGRSRTYRGTAPSRKLFNRSGGWHPSEYAERSLRPQSLRKPLPRRKKAHHVRSHRSPVGPGKRCGPGRTAATLVRQATLQRSMARPGRTGSGHETAAAKGVGRLSAGDHLHGELRRHLRVQPYRNRVVAQ